MDDERLQPSASLSGDSGPALTSWKDIAAFFDRHVRTVQRWEREEGLPVHRHPHQKQSSVYAFPDELDAWWRGRSESLAAAADAATWLPQIRRPPIPVVLLATVVGLAAFAAFALFPARLDDPGAGEARPALVAAKLFGDVPGGWLDQPAAADVTGDGIDDLIISAHRAGVTYVVFGGDRALSGTLSGLANVVIRGAARGQWAALDAGDINGDGINDLLISRVPVEPESFSKSGEVYVLFGRADWPPSLELPHEADVTFTFASANDVRLHGCEYANRRFDLNGDDIDDVVISAPEYSIGEARSAGAVFVFWGRREWRAQIEVVANADVTVRGTRTGEGVSGCGAGDFDGDGRPDLLVAASEGTLWEMLGGQANFYVFLGADTWARHLTVLDADFRASSPLPEKWGISMILADIDADGADDLVAGFPDHRDEDPAPGEVHIWRGRTAPQATPRDQTAPAPDVVIRAPRAGIRFGTGIVASDVDFDGAHDLVVSAERGEAVYLWYGRPTTAPAAATGESSRSGLVSLFRDPLLTGVRHGIAVADVNGDGLTEVIASSPQAPVGAGDDQGVVWWSQVYLPLRIDIRPDQVPNVITWPHGVSAIRIYGAAESGNLDPDTIRFAGAAPINVVSDDYDGDGIVDLQAYFDNAMLNIGPDAVRAVVTARSEWGLPAAGVDSIVVSTNGERQPP